MDKTFWITLIIAALMSTPMFRTFTWLSQLLEQLPADDALIHHGRRYAVWWEEPTLVAGDMVCFAIMDAAVVSGFLSLNQINNKLIALSVLIATIITIVWLRGGTQGYTDAVSWGWQWCGPTKNDQSLAGTYHTLYFWVQATFIVLGAILLFYPVSWSIRGFYLVGLLGYGLCFLQFVALQKRFDAYHQEKVEAQAAAKLLKRQLTDLRESARQQY